MKFKKVLVTGDAFLLPRRKYLFQAMSPYFESLDYLPQGNLSKIQFFQKLKKKIPKYLLKGADNFLRKNPQSFIDKSRQTEQRIRQLEYTPDLVFHMFSLFSPFWDKFDIPYVMYLDYNMALAYNNWQQWAPFNNRKELDLWIECERKAYEQSQHIFVMTNVVKTSLIKDYGIIANKITVIGASGNFQFPYEGEKTFGTKQILFNGSDFERKGGDSVLAAFKIVEQTIPEAKLVIVGTKLSLKQKGIENPGGISSPSELEELFLKTDLVISPAYCDPFPRFLIEAMNYGVPCLVSNKDGMPEIVDDGLNGIVFQNPNPEIMGNKIIELLSNIPLLTQMSKNGRDKIKFKLNWDNIANNILHILSNF